MEEQVFNYSINYNRFLNKNYGHLQLLYVKLSYPVFCGILI